MNTIRALFLRYRHGTMLLVALALAMRALVPGGYMVAAGQHRLTVLICADSLGHTIARSLLVPNRPTDAGKARSEAPCHFSALAQAMLGGGAGFAALATLFFAILAGFAPHLPAPLQAGVRLRPPPRAPPRII